MYRYQPTIGVNMEDNEKQALKETGATAKKLDMWASALGLSREDLKDCKLKAIQELADEESRERNCSGSCCGNGCSCKENIKEGTETGYETIKSLNNTIPYLAMLTTLMGSGFNNPVPQINLHLHLAK
jgi:hypothetical protein